MGSLRLNSVLRRGRENTKRPKKLKVPMQLGNNKNAKVIEVMFGTLVKIQLYFGSPKVRLLVEVIEELAERNGRREEYLLILLHATNASFHRNRSQKHLRRSQRRVRKRDKSYPVARFHHSFWKNRSRETAAIEVQVSSRGAEWSPSLLQHQGKPWREFWYEKNKKPKFVRVACAYNRPKTLG